jgi:histone H3
MRIKQKAQPSGGIDSNSKKSINLRTAVNSKKSAVEKVKQKRAHRFRPGVVALKQIRKYQRSTELLLRKLPFNRLCREIMQTYAPEEGLRVRRDTFAALQEISEAYLIDHFSRAQSYAIHAKRVTVMPKDFMLTNIEKGLAMRAPLDPYKDINKSITSIKRKTHKNKEVKDEGKEKKKEKEKEKEKKSNKRKAEKVDNEVIHESSEPQNESQKEPKKKAKVVKIVRVKEAPQITNEEKDVSEPENNYSEDKNTTETPENGESQKESEKNDSPVQSEDESNE